MNITLKAAPGEAPIRLGSFPDLYAPGSYAGKETSYGAQFMIPKGTKAWTEFEAAVKRFFKDSFGDAAQTAFSKQQSGTAKVFRDGDSVDGLTSDGNPRTGWAGHYRVKASTRYAPKIVGLDLQPITEESGAIYAGCNVSAQITLYARRDSKEIGIRLLAVQKVADNEPFAGGAGGVDLSAFGPAQEAPAADKAEW